MSFPDALELLKNLPRPIRLFFKRVDFKNLSSDKSAENMKNVRMYSFEEDKLGFELKDNIDISGRHSVIVSSIKANSNAAKFKSMGVGDIIVRVENKNVQDIEKDEIEDLLSNQTYRPLEIGFLPDEAALTKMNSEDYSCTFGVGEPLGIEIGDGVENGKQFVEIVNITPGGAAEKDPRLSMSDRIVRVGKNTVHGKSLSDVVDLIRKATRPLEIGFVSKTSKK